MVRADGQCPLAGAGGDPVLNLAPALPDLARDFIALVRSGIGHQVGRPRGTERDAVAHVGVRLLQGKHLLDFEKPAGFPIDGVLQIDLLQPLVHREPLNDRNTGDIAADAHDRADRTVLLQLHRANHVDDGSACLRLDAQGVAAALFRRGDFDVLANDAVQFLIEYFDAAGGAIHRDTIVFVLHHVGPDDAPRVLRVVVGIHLENGGRGELVGCLGGNEVVRLVAERRNVARNEYEIERARNILAVFFHLEGNGSAARIHQAHGFLVIREVARTDVAVERHHLRRPMR